ncbi:endonuclease domain-containing protein [Pseudofulvibacter geojedonensis]|uniref:Endonuclease domain-containing protein n=1 Tax=Pseudofulvibacter geojedonensis TaxID=1123758 RepID=A0ABW3I5R6_9FLAO
MKKKRIHNRKYLVDFRKFLRNNVTSAEATLWNSLKGKKVEGLKFRRQHSIENYIVDFYCPELKLIIELDGEVHANFGQENYDNTRTERLEDLGFIVIRFENKVVFKNPEMIVNAILDIKNQ